MNGVQFSEEQSYGRVAPRSKGTVLTGLVIRSGLAKDQKQAEYTLVGIAVAAIAIAIAIWLFSSSATSTTPLGPPEQTIIPGEGGLPAGNLRDTL